MQTPTPIPYSPQIEQGLTFLTEALRQGLLGILFIVVLTGLVMAVAMSLYIYTRRNKKDNSSTINEALLTFARMNEEQLKRAQEEKEWQRKMDIRRDIQIKRMNNRQIESISALSESNHRLADNFATSNNLLNAINSNNQLQTVNTEAMRSDLNQMVQSGSIPLQGAISSINAVKDIVTQIAQRQMEDRIVYNRCTELLTSAQQILQRMEAKHKTGEHDAVLPNHQ